MQTHREKRTLEDIEQGLTQALGGSCASTGIPDMETAPSPNENLGVGRLAGRKDPTQYMDYKIEHS